MDLQNVKNITIPEGNVNTIHDKDGKLLWGRLAYDTKYAGDTFQQTYSGKNLIGFPQTSLSTDSLTIDFDDDGTITIDGTRSVTTATGYNLSTLFAFKAGDITLTVIPISGTFSGATVGYRAWSGVTQVFYQGYRPNGTYAGFTSITQQNVDDTAGIELMIGSGTAVFNNFKFKMQVTTGSSHDATYEKFVGGTASPNPDYPQDIDVVTGAQTVQITAGTESENFTVNLGSIELCKIGTYQDYIYKSGDDWYVHKDIGYHMFNGTETWTLNTNYANNTRFTCEDVTGNKTTKVVISNYFSKGIGGTDTQNIDLNGTSGKVMITISNTIATTLPSFTTWLSTNTPIAYYALPTPTDTKITDNTLIGQLNAIHKWLTRYGYSSSVTGNLPMIINQTNL